MADPTRIDYTAMRKGTRIGRRRIDVCPKCGRKGLIKPACHDIYGHGWPTTVDHAATDIGWAIHTDDHCFLKDRPDDIGSAARRGG